MKTNKEDVRKIVIKFSNTYPGAERRTDLALNEWVMLLGCYPLDTVKKIISRIIKKHSIDYFPKIDYMEKTADIIQEEIKLEQRNKPAMTTKEILSSKISPEIKGKDLEKIEKLRKITMNWLNRLITREGQAEELIKLGKEYSDLQIANQGQEILYNLKNSKEIEERREKEKSNALRAKGLLMLKQEKVAAGKGGFSKL